MFWIWTVLEEDFLSRLAAEGGGYHSTDAGWKDLDSEVSP